MSGTDPLVERAREAALRAYAPYSKFQVGCAIEAEDGSVVVGSNMENACYRLGVCAEVAALAAASQAFGLGAVKRIAVAGGRAGPDGRLAGNDIVTSCGGCRQSMFEAALVSGRDIEVISASGDGTAARTDRISGLLPHPFDPRNLENAPR